MVWDLQNQTKVNHAGRSVKYNFIDFIDKPIEIYAFIDPVCNVCWTLNPILKKLSLEYGRFFTIRPVIIGHMSNVLKPSSNVTSIWEKTSRSTNQYSMYSKNATEFPWITAMGIKAAGFQGNKAARTYLRNIQEAYFIQNKDIADERVLITCAINSELDVEEFKNDLYSQSSEKAFQCDIKVMLDMGVQAIPALVFFNHIIGDYGVKICGVHSYETYVHILKEVLQKDVAPAKKPSLEEFLAHYKLVGNEELSIVFDRTHTEVEKEMKKLVLKRKVKKMYVNYDIYWKYIS